jgi:AcrR family transcriptional regulator
MVGSNAIPKQCGVSERIRRVGIMLFRARGYHGTSMRALADAVGLDPATLYHYFPSKQEILCAIFDRAMDDLLAGLERALGRSTRSEARLRAFVRFHVLFHVERRDEAFITHSELRSLTESNRRRMHAERDHYEAMLRTLLKEGINAGVFESPDLRLVTIAILTMCSGVSDWFTKGGRLSGDAIADAYADMVCRLLARSRPTRSRKPPAAHERSSASRRYPAQRRLAGDPRLRPRA